MSRDIFLINFTKFETAKKKKKLEISKDRQVGYFPQKAFVFTQIYYYKRLYRLKKQWSMIH